MIIKNSAELKQKIWSVAKRVDLDNPQIQEIEAQVKEILKQVREGGHEAVKQLTQKFDKQNITEFRVSPVGYLAKLSAKEQNAIKLAASRIERFQKACLPQNNFLNEELGRIEVLHRPLQSVGVYVPGGSAPLISTLLMTAIPALVAGVARVVVCSPPPIHPGILAVAEYLGLTEIYQIGGAQAVGALAYGLPEIGLEPVDKIVGPGNLFVTLAKKAVYGTVGIDALYGPSELMIIADKLANPKSLARDLMSQLEHGSGFEAACLLTDSLEVAQGVLDEFEKVLVEQPKREMIEKSWRNFGIIGVTDSLLECCELVNIFAPEHLEIKVTHQHEIVPLIKNAGAIFMAKSNEAIGDYLAGPSHCLPTGRSARFSSGLSVQDFLKRSSLVDLQPNQELIEATATLARMEGLEAHAQAALNCIVR